MYLTNRYITKGLLSICLLVALVLTSIIWLTQSLRLLELIVNSSAPFSLFFKMIVFSLPKFMEVICPVAVMTSVIFIYNRMISDNELIIMRSAGISPLVLSRPAITISAGVTAILLIMSTWLSPVAIGNMYNLKQVVKAEYSTFLLREGVFNPVSTYLTIYLRERGHKGELKGLLIHDTRPENKTPVTITAKRGVVLTTEKEPKVIIYDGMRQQFEPETKSMSRLGFERYTLEIKDFQSEVSKRWRSEKQRTLTELIFQTDLNDEQKKKYSYKFYAEASKRIITPFSAIGYAMIALVCLLTGSFNRRGQVKRILMAIGITLVLQSSYLGLASLIKTEIWAIPVLYISVLAPIFISLFILSDKGRILISRLLKSSHQQKMVKI